MHALRHVQELLAPGGRLVDLHPIEQTTLEVGGVPVGELEEPDWFHVMLPNAEARLAEAIRNGWMILEAETELAVLTEYDTVDDLLAERTELEEQPELAARARSAAGPLTTRDRVVLRVLTQ